MDPADVPPAYSIRYATLTIVLHWLIAALLAFEVALGLNMEDARGTAKFTVFQLHKSVGITILLLVLLRIVWRFRRRPPPLTATGWERTLAKIVHGAFYLLLLALPVSGWIVVSASKIAVPTLLYGTIPWPHLPGFATMTAGAKEAWNHTAEFVHVNLVTVLYGLVALHVAGALKHHFIDRDGDMARIAPGVRTGSWSDPRLLAIGLMAVGTVALGLTWGVGRGKPVAPPIPASILSPVEPGAELTAETPAAESSAAPEAEASAVAETEVSSWAIERGSSLGFRTTYSGEAIVGNFSKFEGDIDFGPDALDRSNVTITVDTGLVASGDSSRDETLKGDDFFAIGADRTAVFRAERFRKTGPERFIAQGTLRMKGMTAPLSIPFSLKIAGNEATMRGTATIDRLTYKIGEGDYASTAEIPAAVAIDIMVKARRK